MRTSELVDAISRLERSTHRLHEAWLETRKLWDDAVADDFESQHLDPLLPELKRTMAAVNELSAVFATVRDACADPAEGESR